MEIMLLAFLGCFRKNRLRFNCSINNGTKKIYQILNFKAVYEYISASKIIKYEIANAKLFSHPIFLWLCIMMNILINAAMKMDALKPNRNKHIAKQTKFNMANL